MYSMQPNLKKRDNASRPDTYMLEKFVTVRRSRSSVGENVLGRCVCSKIACSPYSACVKLLYADDELVLLVFLCTSTCIQTWLCHTYLCIRMYRQVRPISVPLGVFSSLAPSPILLRSASKAVRQ